MLVTGASTGIGRRITKRLASNGHFVHATARKPADLEELGKIPNVQAVLLDVTNPQEIADAVVTITNAGRGLYAVVNNAGVAVRGTFLETTEDDMQYVMNVNAYDRADLIAMIDEALAKARPVPTIHRRARAAVPHDADGAALKSRGTGEGRCYLDGSVPTVQRVGMALGSTSNQS